MTTEKPELQTWELAAKEGKTVIQGILGPTVGVFYPYKKGGDLYDTYYASIKSLLKITGREMRFEP